MSREQAIAFNPREVLFEARQMRGAGNRVHAVHSGEPGEFGGIELRILKLLALNGIERIGRDKDGVSVGVEWNRVAVKIIPCCV